MRSSEGAALASASRAASFSWKARIVAGMSGWASFTSSAMRSRRPRSICDRFAHRRLDRPQLLGYARLELEVAMIDRLELDSEAALRTLVNGGREARHAGDHRGMSAFTRRRGVPTIGDELYRMRPSQCPSRRTSRFPPATF